MNTIGRSDFLKLGAALGLSSLVGCGGSPTAPERNEVFYLHQRGVIDPRYSWERYFPPLDRDETNRLPKRVGVAVFDGDVRLSRPIDWYLRTADYSAHKRVISYQSPRQFIFTIYERTDPVAPTWNVLLERYEEDVKKTGGKILSARVPVAAANAQGRSYLIKTKVKAKPEDYETFAHEIILRGNGRILLVQVLHDANIESTVDEISDALKSMLVY